MHQRKQDLIMTAVIVSIVFAVSVFIGAIADRFIE